MSVYFYLFNKKTKLGLCLGKKGIRSDHEYQGPSVSISEKQYFLPKKYLDLLIESFYRDSESGEILLLEDHELFDTNKYLSEDEDLIEIGGDKYGDIPLHKYLPELDNPSVIDDIRKGNLGS
jgi:hypothetical protein